MWTQWELHTQITAKFLNLDTHLFRESAHTNQYNIIHCTLLHVLHSLKSHILPRNLFPSHISWKLQHFVVQVVWCNDDEYRVECSHLKRQHTEGDSYTDTISTHYNNCIVGNSSRTDSGGKFKGQRLPQSIIVARRLDSIIHIQGSIQYPTSVRWWHVIRRDAGGISFTSFSMTSCPLPNECLVFLPCEEKV
jgi:hypothetical protein